MEGPERPRFVLFGSSSVTIRKDGALFSLTSILARSMLARDLQYLQSIVLYDQEGEFVGIRRPNSKLPICINGTKIVIVDAIGSTGLELKTDPGVPIVYAGFGALLLTTCISILSRAQWYIYQHAVKSSFEVKTS